MPSRPQLHLSLSLVLLLLGACQGGFQDRDTGPGDADQDVAADGAADGDADADGDSCDAHHDTQCGADSELWWVDCRGEPTEIAEACTAADQVCRNDSSCCTPGVAVRCDGDIRRSYDSCDNPEEVVEDCADSDARCVDDVCCVPRQSNRCSEGDLYWADSCGNLELQETCGDDLDCTTDSCDEGSGACSRIADCDVDECRVSVAECQCRVIGTLSCSAMTTGSLAPSVDTRDLWDSYASECDSSGTLDGHEVTYAFSITGRSTQRVTIEVRAICGQELWAFALDGSFSPCDPARCIPSQSHAPPV